MFLLTLPSQAPLKLLFPSCQVASTKTLQSAARKLQTFRVSGKTDLVVFVILTALIIFQYKAKTIMPGLVLEQILSMLEKLESRFWCSSNLSEVLLHSGRVIKQIYYNKSSFSGTKSIYNPTDMFCIYHGLKENETLT